MEGAPQMKNKLNTQPVTPDQDDLAVTFSPISVRANDAAKLLGTTTFFIEEILRAGELPFVTFGKRRVIFVADLIAWAQKERMKQLSPQKIGVAA
jgi:excisionase family DNA binding protein